MKKVMIMIGIAFKGTFAFSSDAIQMEWKFGEDTYKITNSSYNEEELGAFQSIVWDFHKADKEGTAKALEIQGSGIEQYRMDAEKLIQFRAEQFRNGTGSLLLICKNDQEIVGGTYYLLEQNGVVVRMTQAGFKLDLDPQALALIQLNTMNVLSSRQYFHDAEKLIVFLRCGSTNAEKLYMLGFTDSDYTFGLNDPEVNSQEYQSFEKSIGQ